MKTDLDRSSLRLLERRYDLSRSIFIPFDGLPWLCRTINVLDNRLLSFPKWRVGTLNQVLQIRNSLTPGACFSISSSFFLTASHFHMYPWGWSLVIRLDSYQQPWPYLWSIRNSITFQQTTHLQPKSTLASCTILVQLSYHHPYKTTTRPKHPPSCSSQRVIPWSNQGETLKLFSNVVDWEPACQTPSSYGNRLSDVLDPTRKGTFIISSPHPKKKNKKKKLLGSPLWEPSAHKEL